MDFATELLCCLRDRYEAVTGRKMIHDNHMDSDQAEFYFEKLNDNLIEPMSRETEADYKGGDGNELDGKMRALKSSSAMTFNLLGNGEIEVKAGSPFFVPGLYRIEYEKQLETIKNNPHKANLDACLKGEHQLIFCEMKMTEWLLGKPGTLRKSYIQKDLYRHLAIYDAAISCLQQIVKLNPASYQTYSCTMTRYDAPQMFKHLLAIYNFAAENREEIPDSIRLVNCVWHLPSSAGVSEAARARYLDMEAMEHQEFAAFYAATAEMRKRFEDLDIDCDILFMSAEAFANQFVKTPEQKEYLTRYFR